MSLQKCTDCKKKISSQAGSCPNCGAPVVPKKKKGIFARIIRFFGVIFGVFILLAVLSALLNPNPSTTTTTENSSLREISTEVEQVEETVSIPIEQQTEEEKLEAEKQAEQEAEEQRLKAEQDAIDKAEREAEQERRDAERKAEQERRDAEKQEKLERENIVLPNGEYFGFGDAMVSCERSVKDKLKAPRTAKFVGVWSSEFKEPVKLENSWNYLVKVDAENSFGAMLRSNWFCVVNGDDNTVLTEQIQ